MRIIHTGDLNISERMNQEANLKIHQLINEIKESNSNLVVIAGDIVKDGAEEDYIKANELFDKIKTEKVFVPGNRDFYNGGNVCFSSFFYNLEDSLDLSKDSESPRRNGNRPLIIDKDYLLVGICTPRRDQSTGVIGHGQKRHTESLFKEYGKDKYKILVMHHHLLPIPIGGLEENIITDVGDIVRMISDEKIDLVLTGHQHHPWVSEYSSGIKNEKFTTVLTCGTPTMELPRGFRYNSYNVIDINENEKKLENIYVKIVTGEWNEKKLIPINEFVKIPSMTKKDFEKSEYAGYLE